ncbi:MAG: hypothetical protein KC449_01085 [Anaerolineales bacterium]|nr:hypothetical protein [Anaerolineales bacterium]
MGGYGSTRWQLHSKKHTTDDCRSISIFELKRDKLLVPGRFQSGGWVWRNRLTGEKVSSIGYEINLKDESSYLRLYYIHTSGWTNEKFDVDYQVPLKKMACNFGGYRYWFICPISVNGRYCGRRVGKLFLAPGSRYFACRHCHDLTYRSSQESDKTVNMLKKMGTLELLQAMNSGEVDILKGWKALPDGIFRR